jgi:hypothetical protein
VAPPPQNAASAADRGDARKAPEAIAVTYALRQFMMMLITFFVEPGCARVERRKR